MITKEQSKNLFNELNNNEKNNVINALNVTRNLYLIHNISTDFPYFFWSWQNGVFDDINSEDITDFLNITDVRTFSIQIIFYLSKFIISKR